MRLRKKRKEVSPFREDHYFDYIEVGSTSCAVESLPEEFKQPDMSLIPPNTYWLTHADGKFWQLYTISVRGNRVGWANCGVCRLWIPNCQCVHGFSLNRSVEHFIDVERAIHNGEKWDITHRDYYGSYREIREQKRKERYRSTRDLDDTTIRPAKHKLLSQTRKEPSKLQKEPSKMRLKRFDQNSADRDAANLAATKMGEHSPKKLRRKK